MSHSFWKNKVLYLEIKKPFYLELYWDPDDQWVYLVVRGSTGQWSRQGWRPESIMEYAEVYAETWAPKWIRNTQDRRAKILNALNTFRADVGLYGEPPQPKEEAPRYWARGRKYMLGDGGFPWSVRWEADIQKLVFQHTKTNVQQAYSWQKVFQSVKDVMGSLTYISGKALNMPTAICLRGAIQDFMRDVTRYGPPGEEYAGLPEGGIRFRYHEPPRDDSIMLLCVFFEGQCLDAMKYEDALYLVRAWWDGDEWVADAEDGSVTYPDENLLCWSLAMEGVGLDV